MSGGGLILPALIGLLGGLIIGRRKPLVDLSIQIVESLGEFGEVDRLDSAVTQDGRVHGRSSVDSDSLQERNVMQKISIVHGAGKREPQRIAAAISKMLKDSLDDASKGEDRSRIPINAESVNLDKTLNAHSSPVVADAEPGISVDPALTVQEGGGSSPTATAGACSCAASADSSRKGSA